MKFVANIRHRPAVNETIENRFAHLVAAMREIPQPWGLAKGKDLMLPPMGAGISTGAKLRGKLGTGITGMAMFTYRSPNNLRDHGSKDDSLVIEFDAAKTTWRSLVETAFPAYIRAIGAYIAYIYRWDAAPDEWDRKVATSRASEKNLDGRDGFFRFSPIGFMDNDLCIRSCNGLTPDQVVDQLTGIVPEVFRFENGVMITSADHFPTQEEIIATDRRIRQKLGLPIWE